MWEDESPFVNEKSEKEKANSDHHHEFVKVEDFRLKHVTPLHEDIKTEFKLDEIKAQNKRRKMFFNIVLVCFLRSCF